MRSLRPPRPLAIAAMFGLFLLLVLVFCAANAAEAQHVPPQPPAHAILVKQCGYVILVSFTDAAGKTEHIVPTVATLGAISDLLGVTKRVDVLTMKCDDEMEVTK